MLLTSNPSHRPPEYFHHVDKHPDRKLSISEIVARRSDSNPGGRFENAEDVEGGDQAAWMVTPGRSIHRPARHMLNKWRATLKLDTDVSIEPILIR